MTLDEYIYAHHQSGWICLGQLEELQPLLTYLPAIDKSLSSHLPPPIQQIPKLSVDLNDKFHALNDEILLYQEILGLKLNEKLPAEIEVKQLKQKIKILEEEALHFNKVQKRLEAEKLSLREMVAELSNKEINLEFTAQSQKHDQNEYDKELRQAKSRVASLQLKLEEIKNVEKKGAEAIQASKNMQLKMNEMQTKYYGNKESARKVLQENQMIKEKYQKLYTAYKKLKARLKDFEDEGASNETFVNYSLDSTSHTQNLTLSDDTKKLEQEKKLKLTKELQDQLAHKDAIPEDEVRRLIGNLFKIDNSSHWFIKDNDIALGPYNFEQMVEMKEKGEIGNNCMIRQSKETWKPMSNTYEFCVPYKFSVTQEDDKLVKHFYLKREAVRVPFYELVNLDNALGEMKGYCTSLSVGGCFIELGRSEMKVVSLNTHIKLELKSDVLSEALTVMAQVVNISEARPRGIGMMFLDLSEESKKVIQSYVNHCLDSAEQKKKAA
jgi:hypothetical protein